MADNILDAACQRESPQAAKRTRLDSYHTEMFEEPHHPYKVLEGLNKLRLNSVLCDVILCCEGQEFPCHRSVLASFSSYFEAMFTSAMKESTQERVTMSGVEPQMIGLLVNYAYTSKVSISTANVQALLAASDLLDVTAVREACCDYMKSHIDVNNCVEIYCCADDHSCEMLKKHSLDYILEHFSVIYREEEFLSLSVERVTEILASDHLNVPKEDLVFEAAMLWLDKCPTHRQSFEKVLEQIRLPLISPSYLHTVVECLDVVKEHQGCQRFISEANVQPYSNTACPRRTTVIVTVGRKNNKEGFHQVESFDPLTNQWRTLGHVPLRVYGYAVVASGSSLYLVGGYGDSISREMWRYDVHHNSWLKMAPMKMARTNFSLVMLDGYVFAVSGWSSEVRDSMERYDPNTNTWQLKESVGVAVYYNPNSHDVVALDGLLYFIGGAPTPSNPNRAKEVAKYNPETSVWTQVAPMQIPRTPSAASAVCILNGKIYVIGVLHYTNEINRSSWIIENTMECYNPKTNQWSMCAPMCAPMSAPMKVECFYLSMTVVDGKIYIVGGRANEYGYQNIECYCGETDTWETVGDLRAAHHNLNCVSLKLRGDHGLPIVDEDDVSDDD